MILKLLITGNCILISAIIANMIAKLIKITTWYDFYNQLINLGFKNTINTLQILDTLWLFLIYPIILSVGFLIGEKIYIFMTS
ncbi:MAG: hypothetical protein CMD27_04170 [Flavobacteriales bacterium]|nr:hypothetical protein [Flavobacteriales bacterium]|tara:strand:+ start:54 stop:302 length:249 start_codon:yes stop_codon:yes gene_type:complete